MCSAIPGFRDVAVVGLGRERPVIAIEGSANEDLIDAVKAASSSVITSHEPVVVVVPPGTFLRTMVSRNRQKSTALILAHRPKQMFGE